MNKCGLDAVRAVMPEEHMKLLTSIRKVGVVSFDFGLHLTLFFVFLTFKLSAWDII